MISLPELASALYLHVQKHISKDADLKYEVQDIIVKEIPSIKGQQLKAYCKVDVGDSLMHHLMHHLPNTIKSSSVCLREFVPKRTQTQHVLTRSLWRSRYWGHGFNPQGVQALIKINITFSVL